MNGSLLEQVKSFFNEFFQSLEGGSLFFGGPWDLVRYTFDIIIVAVFFYWIMLFLSQSRAWQLIKGIILIIFIVLLSNFFGLEMVGFLFNKSLVLLATLFIIIFQPELRRALETVGIRSFGSVKSIFSTSAGVGEKTALSIFINEICIACREMAKTYTGALILIERNTKLDELLTQENVVKFDSTVSNSVLQSIFYKGSPMHDGGLLIRNGRIIAARCHVPLSMTMHELERTGTRHRAAVGASEMGDTVVVVVSEERGKTSIAVNGHLYEMKNIDELEANLSYLLGLTEVRSTRKGVGRLFGKLFGRDKTQVKTAGAEAVDANAPAANGNRKKVLSPAMPVTKASEETSEVLDIKTLDADKVNSSMGKRIVVRIFFAVLSLVLSCILWVYIQINNNPVMTKTITVPITYYDSMTPDDFDVSYPIETVDVTFIGRKETIERLSEKNIVAMIDYSSVNQAGVVELPIGITATESNMYYRVESQVPETISVTIYAHGEEME